MTLRKQTRQQINKILLSSPEEIQKILDLYQNGKSIDQISRLLFYGEKIIKQILITYNISIKSASEFRKEKSHDKLVVEMHLAGKSITDISEELNICRDKVRRIFRDNNIKVEYNKPLTSEEKDNIEKLYLSGMQITSIAEYFNHKTGTIKNVILNKNIILEKRTNYRVNWNCLDNIDSEIKAFTLGFLWLTPCLDFAFNTLEDAKILENISLLLCNKDITTVSKRGYRFNLTNKQFNQYIKSIGCGSNKMPTLESKTLMLHFIRGILDREGGLYINKLSDAFVSVVGNREFLEQLQLWLKENLNIKTALYPTGGSKSYYLRITNTFIAFEFLDHLYKDATCKLSSNYNNYINNNADDLDKIFNKNCYEMCKKRKKEDPAYKLRRNISREICKILKKQGFSKKGESILKYLPYNFTQFKQHLESLFEPWMNWQNHKIYNAWTWDDNDSSTWTWNIDHIIPQSDLPYTSMEDENFKICWGLANLRPLSAKQNVIDGARRTRHNKLRQEDEHYKIGHIKI